MPVVGAGFLYQVTVTGSVGGITTKNVFWYFTTGPQKDAADVATAFIAEVETNWEAAVSVNWNGLVLDVDEVTSQSNFSTEAITFGGTQIGESLPPYDAFSIQLSRSTKETRSGRKRLAGVSELSQSSGNIIASQITNLIAVKDDFIEDLTVAGGSVPPVIVRKTFVDPPTVPPSHNPPDEWLYNPLDGGIVSSKVTTQNSRKT